MEKIRGTITFESGNRIAIKIGDKYTLAEYTNTSNTKKGDEIEGNLLNTEGQFIKNISKSTEGWISIVSVNRTKEEAMKYVNSEVIPSD